MEEFTIVAQRLVYARGIMKVSITPEMEKMFGSFHQAYQTGRKVRLKEKFQKKKEATIILQNTIAQKKSLVEEMQNKILTFDDIQEQL